MITIRQACVEDAEALAYLAERTFRETFATVDNSADMALYSEQNFGVEIQQQQIVDSNYAMLLAEAEGSLIAFAQVRLHAPKDCITADHPSELHRLYADKAWHGQGLAQKMMAEVLSTVATAGADQLWLGVWENNPRAIAFYRKCGFSAVGEHVFQFGNEAQRDLIMAMAVNNLSTN